MSRDASGNYSLAAGNPVTTGTTISSTTFNNTMADLATAMSDSFSRNGNGAMTVGLKGFAGTVSAPGLSFNSDPASGLFLNTAGDVRMAVTGSLIEKWTSAGVAITGTLTVSSTCAVTGTITQGGVNVRLSTANNVLSASSGVSTNATTTYAQVTNLSVSITATGAPIIIQLVPDGTTANVGAYCVVYMSTTASAPNTFIGSLRVSKNGGSTYFGEINMSMNLTINTGIVTREPGAFRWFDASPTPGSITYSVWFAIQGSNCTVGVAGCKLQVFEI
jgi:hypothetical protein